HGGGAYHTPHRPTEPRETPRTSRLAPPSGERLGDVRVLLVVLLVRVVAALARRLDPGLVVVLGGGEALLEEAVPLAVLVRGRLLADEQRVARLERREVGRVGGEGGTHVPLHPFA